MTNKKNLFKFYTEKEDIQDNRKATREIKKEVEKFKSKIAEIMYKYKKIGATDTQSREEIIRFISNRINEDF